MRRTLQTIKIDVAKPGRTARLAKASDYYYFYLGEAAEWLDGACEGAHPEQPCVGAMTGGV